MGRIVIFPLAWKVSWEAFSQKEASFDDLAKRLQNPIANLIAFHFKVTSILESVLQLGLGHLNLDSEGVHN